LLYKGFKMIDEKLVVKGIRGSESRHFGILKVEE
jgi:hypothetical protein